MCRYMYNGWVCSFQWFVCSMQYWYSGWTFVFEVFIICVCQCQKSDPILSVSVRHRKEKMKGFDEWCVDERMNACSIWRQNKLPVHLGMFYRYALYTQN